MQVHTEPSLTDLHNAFGPHGDGLQGSLLGSGSTAKKTEN